MRERLFNGSGNVKSRKILDEALACRRGMSGRLQNGAGSSRKEAGE